MQPAIGMRNFSPETTGEGVKVADIWEVTKPLEFHEVFYVIVFYITVMRISSLPVHLVVKYYAKNRCYANRIRRAVSE